MIKSIFFKFLILSVILAGISGIALAQTLSTPITGTMALCANASTQLTDATPGGTWSSTVTSVAVVGSVNGTVYGISTGTTTITYMVGALYATATVTVLSSPRALSMYPFICLNSVGVMSDGTPGGTWASLHPSIIKVDAVTGADTVKSLGIDTIIYTLSSGCSTAQSFSVYSLPTADTVIGGGAICGVGSVHVRTNYSTYADWYQLYHNGVAVGSAIYSTGGSIDFGAFSAAGVYTATVKNNSTGCVATLYDSVTITANPLPPVDTITAIGSYCSSGPGDTIRMRSSTLGIRYQLFQGTTPIGGYVPGTGSSINFGARPTGTYYAIATNNITGCKDTMYDSVKIVSIPGVTPSVSVSVSPGDTVCPGGHVVVFTATPVNGGVSPLYIWKVNRAPMATGPTFTYIPTGSDTVTVALTSSATCASPSTVTYTDYLVYNYAPPISGPANVCLGGTSTLTDAVGGGTWSSSDPSVATIATIGGSIGVSSGVKVGTATLTYSLISGCYAISTVTVSPLPAISVTSSTTCGDTYHLAATGGVKYAWTPSTGLYCDTCAHTDANITTSTIYTVTGTDTVGCSGANTVSLNGDRIYGHISFASLAPDTLDMKVWLIKYNLTDSSITALDSTLTCTVDSSGYYEFDAKPAGDYMVKARMVHGAPGMSGYIPTYGSSAVTWNTGTTIAHTGASDIQDITMIYGTVPSGPGFIGGYVYSGAGKGTAGADDGLVIYLRDLTNNTLTYTYTDKAGAYSFRSLAYGDYVIYPEAFDYKTIPSGIISLTTDSATVNNINFRQLTTSKVIRPFTVQVAGINSVSNNGVAVFPNPTNGIALNIKWIDQQPGDATVRLSDITGRPVYSASLDINEPSGIATIDLRSLSDGVYIVNITSAGISYSGRLLIQR